MYHAPVSADLAPHELSPAEMPEGDVGYEGDSTLDPSPIKDGQAEAAGHFASFYALANIGSALIVGWAIYGHAQIGWIAGWAALVVAANWLVYRRAIDAA